MEGEYSVDERSDEISRLSEDEVLLAILVCIVDTGGSTPQDLVDLGAFTKEPEDLLVKLVDSGIIEECDGELKITEKGRNLLKTLEECEAISRDAEDNSDMIVGV